MPSTPSMPLTRRASLALAGGLALPLAGLRPSPALAQDASWPFAIDAAALRRSAKRVYAHWHIFKISEDNMDPARDRYSRLLGPEGMDGKYAEAGGLIRERPLPRPPRAGGDWLAQDMEEDVRRGAAVGLDGFQFNILSIKPQSPFWESLVAMLAAAERVGGGFTVMLSVDATAMKRVRPEALVEVLRPLLASPAVARMPDGRPILGCFKAELFGADWWGTLVRGLDAAFMPSFVAPERIEPSGLVDLAEGLNIYGDGTPTRPKRLARTGAIARRHGKLWLAPICPQEFRPKDKYYLDAENTRLFRERWAQAMDADWAQVVTWNDYTEGTEIAPSTGIQWVFYDLCAYHLAWFKAGTPPPVTRDALFYTHRIQPVGAAPQEALPAASRFRFVGERPPGNQVELLAFLERPGRLEVELAGATAGTDAPAGLTAFTVPAVEGRPRFRLRRGERTVIELESAFAIRPQGRFVDLLYRAGSSTRPVVTMVQDPA